jgi:hypothetical protein
MNHAIKSLSRALWDTDLIGIRCTLALSELMWAVMLLWPGDTFTRPTYAHMAMLWNEEIWALVMLTSAVTQLTIVLQDDLHSRFARYFAAYNAVLWVYIGIVSPLLSVYPPPAAMGGEMALAIASFWIWLRPYFLSAMYEKGYRDARVY